jgi:hypothetical protein
VTQAIELRLCSAISINRGHHMGGFGSSRWGGYRRHQNDREAVKIALTRLRTQLRNPCESTVPLDATDATGRLVFTTTLKITRVEWQHGELTRELRFDAHQRRNGWVNVIRLVAITGNVGRLAWLACCPQCKQPVRTLFVPRSDITPALTASPRCRRCCGLRYATQQASPEERAELAINRATRRLRPTLRDLLDGDMPKRPRGMHRTTYRRLRDAFLHAEQVRDELVLRGAARLIAKFETPLGARRAQRGI